MNVDQAKNSSKSFHKAFHRAMEPRPTGPNQFEMLAVPGVVCAAFAIELGLKALVLQKGVQAKGHDLEKLFSKLEPAQQTALIKAVGIAESDFNKELKATANAFIDWRYIYEAPGSVSANLDFLRRLSEAIQNHL